MASGGIHTVFKNGKWVNETEGAARAISRHDTNAEAQARGREVAKKRKVEHHIGAASPAAAAPSNQACGNGPHGTSHGTVHAHHTVPHTNHQAHQSIPRYCDYPH